MAKLSLSEVSKQFNIDRSTIYRAVRNGRLSRSSDGNFDISEVIRCFGEPEPAVQPNQPAKQSTDTTTQKLISHLESEVKKYQEREERLMQQIDRMQTLIELKSVANTTAMPQEVATACDTSMQQQNSKPQTDENKEYLNNLVTHHVALPQQETMAGHTLTQQHATLQNVAMPHSKKRGLFGRVLQAIVNID